VSDGRARGRPPPDLTRMQANARRDIVSSTARTSSKPGSPAIPILSIEELEADPHVVFRRYRPQTPFIQRKDGSYIAIRAADVQSLLNDPRARQMETDLLKLRGITEGPLFDALSNSMLFSNGDMHRRRRAPMSRAFAFRIIGALRPQIRAVADELIGSRLAEGEMDLLRDYAALIPARMIAEILGLPREDVTHFTGLVYTVSRVFSFSFTDAEVPAMTDAARQLAEYVERLLSDRRASPSDDFLSAFVRIVDEDSDLSPAEVLSQVASVIIGGSDTTRVAIAVQAALLLQRREQWEAICADAALIPGAVTESLRYEPAVGSAPRFTLADIEIDGFVAPAGRILTLSTMSATRDPALYPDPDRYDIRRTGHPRWQLAFGGGAHRCLGEALARTELEEALGALAARIPQLRPAGDLPRVKGHSGIRRLEAMPVTWR
jgi:cytochrome P450 family 103